MKSGKAIVTFENGVLSYVTGRSRKTARVGEMYGPIVKRPDGHNVRPARFLGYDQATGVVSIMRDKAKSATGLEVHRFAQEYLKNERQDVPRPSAAEDRVMVAIMRLEASLRDIAAKVDRLAPKSNGVSATPGSLFAVVQKEGER